MPPNVIQHSAFLTDSRNTQRLLWKSMYARLETSKNKNQVESP